jgi:hypothetical protein
MNIVELQPSDKLGLNWDKAGWYATESSVPVEQWLWGENGEIVCPDAAGPFPTEADAEDHVEKLETLSGGIDSD